MLQFLSPIIAGTVVSSLSFLVLRVTGGIPMMLHGVPKLFGPKRSQSRSMFEKQGMPGPFFDSIALLEFLGGIFLVVGFLTPLASGLLALEMVGTTLLHVVKLRKPPVNSKFTGGYELDILFLGITLAIFLLGPGIYSLDFLL